MSDTSGGPNVISVCSATVFVVCDFLHVLLKMRGLLPRGESNPSGSMLTSEVLGLAFGLLLMVVPFLSPS